jgi:hypothetical protein
VGQCAANVTYNLDCGTCQICFGLIAKIVLRHLKLTGSPNDEDGKEPGSRANNLVKMIESRKDKKNNEDDCSYERGRIAVELKARSSILVVTHVI